MGGGESLSGLGLNKLVWVTQDGVCVCKGGRGGGR